MYIEGPNSIQKAAWIDTESERYFTVNESINEHGIVYGVNYHTGKKKNHESIVYVPMSQ